MYFWSFSLRSIGVSGDSAVFLDSDVFRNNKQDNKGVHRIMIKHKKLLKHQNGKIYFTQKTERYFYFVLTMIMLLLGIFFKTGVL